MAHTITTAFVKQFDSNIIMLSQQRGSRLERSVRYKEAIGEEAYFERLAATAARRRTSRHSDTPLMNSQHSRRMCAQWDFDWADLIDREDEVRMLISPESSYAMNAAWALGRAKDEVILEAATGIAQEGKNGQTGVALPAGQKIAVNYDSASDTNLTLDKVIHAKSILDANEATEPDQPKYLWVTAAMLESMLKHEQPTSGDYAAIKALIQGELTFFMGFNWIRTELLGTDANGDRQAVAVVGDGVGLCVGRDQNSRISERDDKNYATQVFASMTIGAVRIEDEKVVEIACDESVYGPST